VIGGNILEVYEDGIFIHTKFGSPSDKQSVYFNQSDSLSPFQNEVLIDYGFDDWRYWELHFLLDTGFIVTYRPSNRDENYTNLTDISISNRSLL